MHYSAKHPAGTEPDPVIAAALRTAAADERITCAQAHELARELRVTPAEVGMTMDLLEYRITRCQMGIFGYQPEKKVLVAADSVSDELRALLQDALVEGCIPCASCWAIADALGVEKSAVAAACERLQLQIKPCQLGAF